MLDQLCVWRTTKQSRESRLDELERVGFEGDDAEFVCEDKDVDVVEDVFVCCFEGAFVVTLVEIVECGCYGLGVVVLHVDDAGTALLSWC